MKKALVAVVVLLTLLLIGVGGLVFSLDARAHAPASTLGTEVEFEVPKGANARTVAVQLQRAGLIDDPLVFRYVVWRRGGLALKAGRFRFPSTASAFELAGLLETAPIADDERVHRDRGLALPGRRRGARCRRARMTPGAYLNRGRPRATVEAPFAVTAGHATRATCTPRPTSCRRRPRRPPGGARRAPAGPRSQPAVPRDALEARHQDGEALALRHLVMASMLEREEPKPSNRPLVAGILWKRIDEDTPLGVDATSRYQLVADWNDRGRSSRTCATRTTPTTRASAPGAAALGHRQPHGTHRSRRRCGPVPVEFLVLPARRPEEAAPLAGCCGARGSAKAVRRVLKYAGVLTSTSPDLEQPANAIHRDPNRTNHGHH
jgi:UPF0755 protein